MLNKFRLPICFILLVVFFLPLSVAIADNCEIDIPEGFDLVMSDIGASLYKGNNRFGSIDFVQVVDLSQGAGIDLLHGDIVNSGTGRGSYDYAVSPSFRRNSLTNIWSSYISSESNAFCITNGQFFSTNNDPTQLAFPLKEDGVIVSTGYGEAEYPGQKLILEIWNDHLDIIDLTEESLRDSNAPDIIAGLDQNADKGPSNSTGRTFVGIADSDNDQQFETLLIFNSQYSTQKHAVDTLRSFGAEKFMMLDGGGSTQLICKGDSFISSSRTIPQSLAVLSKPRPSLDASLISQSNWIVLNTGESAEIKLEILNTGAETWNPDRVFLKNLKNNWGASDLLSIPGSIKTDQKLLLTWQTNAFSQAGIFTSKWVLAKDNVQFGEKININVVILPVNLSEEKEELESKIREWINQGIENIEAEIYAWIKEQSASMLNRFTDYLMHLLTDDLCFSAVSVPVVAVSFAVVRKRQRNK